MVNKKPKVIHIVPALDIGGIEAMIFNYYQTLLDESSECLDWEFIVHGEKIGLIEQKIIDLGAKVHHVTPKNTNVFKYFRDLIRIFTSTTYDIVHAHQSHLSFYCLSVAYICGIPIRIAHSHTCLSLTNKNNFKDKMLKALNKLFATDFAVCGQAAGISAFGSINNSKWIINGIKVENYKFNCVVRSELRDKYCIDDNDVVLGMVCRLSKEKNIPFILEVLENLIYSNKLVKYKLFICGDGDELTHIKGLIENLNLSDYVFLLGRIENSNDYYSFFDIFLLPSFYEGFPVSLIESQCAGLPSLISNSISTESVINNNVSILPIEKQCSSLWAKSIISTSTFDDREYNHELDIFNINNTANSLLTYYNEIYLERIK